MSTLFPMLLGLAAGVLLARFSARRRACGGQWRGGCGRYGGHRFFRRFHPVQLLWLGRELHLDATQREQVKDILRAMQRLGMDVRFDQAERMEALVEAMRADRFDRAHVDQAVSAQLEKEAAARREVLDRIELFHAGLTSEQRETLKRHLASFGQSTPPPPPPAGTPAA